MLVHVKCEYPIISSFYRDIRFILRQNEATVPQGSQIVVERLSMAWDINFSHLQGSGTVGYSKAVQSYLFLLHE
jgi:hypothetical protein